MPDLRRDCPRCHERIHPLELSDLYRGRKLNCARCGSGLRARVMWWVEMPAAALLAMALAYLGISLGLTYVGGFVLGILGTWIAALARFGLLVEGAPWVRLAAREKPWRD